MDIKLRLEQAIALALMTMVGLGSPPKAMAMPFSITKEVHSFEYNIDQPGIPSGFYSQASQSGSQTQNVTETAYNLSAQSSVHGWISSGLGTSGRAAGGYRKEIWAITLNLAGEDGDQADLFIEGTLWGEGSYFISSSFEASSSGIVEAYLGVRNAAGQELFSYPFSSTYHQKIIGTSYNEFQDDIDPFFLGTASAGDEITIYGYLYQGASAGDLGGFESIHASAETNSRISFQINAIENLQPVPEPNTVILLGAGLIGLAASRKILKK